MRAWVRGGTACLTALAGLASCVHTTTYGYQYRVQQEFAGGEEPEPAPREAQQLLASARTVAFFPPDVCLNVDAGAIGAAKAKVLRANCGVLLSNLERAAERAGYEVLSWQNLRGSKRPIDYARDANVDVLFEINEVDLSSVDDTTIQRTLTFFERNTASDSPLVVPAPVAETCKNYANQADPARQIARTGTVDIKTVSVSDGRTRWRYRKTLSRSFGRTYPQVLFAAPEKPNPLGAVGVVVGGIALGGGAGLAIAEGVSQPDPLNPKSGGFDTHGISTILIVGGALALAGGIALEVELGGTKPDPAEVLCNGKFAVATAAPVVNMVGPSSSQHTFQETTGGTDDQVIDQQLRVQMIGQFIDELKTVHGNAPVPPPAPPPPAPPPAPAPAPPPAPAPGT